MFTSNKVKLTNWHFTVLFRCSEETASAFGKWGVSQSVWQPDLQDSQPDTAERRQIARYVRDLKAGRESGLDAL